MMDIGVFNVFQDYEHNFLLIIKDGTIYKSSTPRTDGIRTLAG